jgi:chromate reductase, NAD(P)H dehydrogenase (quinone)
MTKKIAVLACTDRPGSRTFKVASYIHQQYEKLNVDSNVISLTDYPFNEVFGGKYGKEIPAVTAFNQNVLSHDGLVFVIPEYNGSFPGVFKLFIDYLPFPKSFLGVPIAFVGVATGSFGALRAVEHAQQVVGYRNGYVFPERVFIARADKNFDPVHGLSDRLYAQLLDSQIKNFSIFVSNTLPKPEPLS